MISEQSTKTEISDCKDIFWLTDCHRVINTAGWSVDLNIRWLWKHLHGQQPAHKTRQLQQSH